jgi:hypothetical protein
MVETRNIRASVDRSHCKRWILINPELCPTVNCQPPTLRILGYSHPQQQHNDTKDMRHVSSETKDVHAHGISDLTCDQTLFNPFQLSFA